MIRALIVDDERKSREVLKSLLELYCEDVEIVEMVENISEAIRSINEHKPELLFLDISLKEGDSFMILDQLEIIDFEIVFITAFDEYSVKALNYSDIPCLLKPIDIDELVKVVEDIAGRSSLKTPDAYVFANHLLKSKFLKIPILEEGGIRLLDQSKISSLTGQENGTKITMSDGKEIPSQRDLTKFRYIVSSDHFFPVDKNLLVNLIQVDVPPERFRSFVRMKNGNKISIPKSKLKKFWESYKGIASHIN
jgi:two-component system LytT family response regulator